MAELLDDLGQGLPGAGTLEDVGGGGAAVQGGAEGQVLDLAGAQGQAHLDTPDLTDVGDTVAAHAVVGGEDDLLLGFDLVALELPAGGVLDDVAVVDLGDLLNQRGHVRLGGGLLGGGLLLLLVGAAGQEAGGNHQSEQELVGVVGGVDQVGGAAGHLVGGGLVGDNDHVANDGTEAIDLGTELDLGDLTGLEGDLGLLSLRDQRSVRGHVGVGGDGGGVSDAC